MTMDGLCGRILDGNAVPGELAKKLRCPKKIGTLIGKTRMFGDNAECRYAFGLIKGWHSIPTGAAMAPPLG